MDDKFRMAAREYAAEVMNNPTLGYDGSPKLMENLIDDSWATCLRWLRDNGHYVEANGQEHFHVGDYIHMNGSDNEIENVAMVISDDVGPIIPIVDKAPVYSVFCIEPADCGMDYELSYRGWAVSDCRGATEEEKETFKKKAIEIASHDPFSAHVLRKHAMDLLEQVDESQLFHPFDKVITAVADTKQDKAIWMPAFYAGFDRKRKHHALMTPRFVYDANGELTATHSYSDLDRRLPILPYNDRTELRVFRDCDFFTNG